MSTEMIWQTVTTNSVDTGKLGELLGSNLSGSAVIELVSDLGGGKTTFTKGLAKGLGCKDTVSSPTFTISRIYKTKAGELHHFDFYRLAEPGLVADQLKESLEAKDVITVIEWSGIVKGVLPEDRLTIEFKPTVEDPDEREITIVYADKFIKAIKALETNFEGGRP